MNKLTILVLFSLSLVFAGQKYTYTGCQEANSCNCHPSCICDVGSSICKSCRIEGSIVDEFKRSCPCPSGYFTKSLDPFTCEEFFVPNQSQQCGNQDDACVREGLQKLRNIILDTNCYSCNIDGKSYVISEVSLNFNQVSLNSDCKSEFTHKIQYLHPKTHAYVDLPSIYITVGQNGSLTIKIPLIDVYTLATSTVVGSQQIAQQIKFMSTLGVKSKVGKMIKWANCVYTNRDVVQVFQIDIDVQQTSQDCEDCIIIADMQTVGKIYTDSTFTTLKTAPYSYLVGDYFYAKITFVDSSFTKYLKFVSLYYKNNIGQIYDYSLATVHAWSENGLTIALPLSEPSHPATIQVAMQIDPISGGRFLQNSDDQQSKQKTTFSFEVMSNKKSDEIDFANGQNQTKNSVEQNQNNDNQQKNQYNNALIILFNIINLIAMIFIL